MTVHRRRMYGIEREIDWNRLPVSQTEHIPQIFYISFPKVTYQRPLLFTGCPGYGMASLINSTGITGGLYLVYWKNTPPLSPNVRCVGTMYRRCASVIRTMSHTSFGLGSSNREVGRLCSIVLNIFRWLSVWMRSPCNMPHTSCTWAIQLHSTTATGRPFTRTSVKHGVGGGWCQIC